MQRRSPGVLQARSHHPELLEPRPPRRVQCALIVLRPSVRRPSPELHTLLLVRPWHFSVPLALSLGTPPAVQSRDPTAARATCPTPPRALRASRDRRAASSVPLLFAARLTDSHYPSSAPCSSCPRASMALCCSAPQTRAMRHLTRSYQCYRISGFPSSKNLNF